MLKNTLTTTALAITLLTSSISAKELTTQGVTSLTQNIESIEAFDNIPTQGLNHSELNEKGENYYSWSWWNILFPYPLPQDKDGGCF